MCVSNIRMTIIFHLSLLNIQYLQTREIFSTNCQAELYKMISKKHLNRKCKSLSRFSIPNAKYELDLRYVLQMLNSKYFFKIKYLLTKSNDFYLFWVFTTRNRIAIQCQSKWYLMHDILVKYDRYIYQLAYQ